MAEHHVTEARFLKDVDRHQMQLLMDNGIYRHIRFKRPDSSCMYFDLITWPGYLAYVGDMGAYTFSRLNDMFEFFRKEPRDGARLSINLGYWSEKLQAADCSGRRDGGSMEYDPEKFNSIVKEKYVEWCREYLRDDKEGRRELREEIERLIANGEDGEDAAHIAARDFRFKRGSRTFEFHDFWEHNLRNFTTRFVWCCYALSWGIQQYDNAKVTEATPTQPAEGEV